MPALITQDIFATWVMDKLEEHITISRDAFRLGAIGPEFLSYHNVLPTSPGKSYRKLAEQLHKCNPNHLFTAMREYVYTVDSNIADVNMRNMIHSYVYGFLCNYSIASKVRPFIEQQVVKYEHQFGNKQKGIFIEAQIGHSLDVLLMTKNGMIVDDCLPENIVSPDRATLAAASNVMRFTVYQMLGKQVPWDEFMHAFDDMRKVLKLLHDPTERKRRVFGKIEDIFKTGPTVSALIRPQVVDDGFDYANVSSGNTDGSLSFFDIVETTVDPSVQQIFDFIETFESKAKIKMFACDFDGNSISQA